VHHDDKAPKTPPRKRMRAAIGAAIGATALGSAAAIGATALGGTTAVTIADTSHSAQVTSHSDHATGHSDHYTPPIRLVVNNPQPHDIAGRNGDFTVLVTSTALNARGNRLLSAGNGYRPGLNLPPARTFGPGMPDPNAPGLVVTLSTTPAAAGGPQANLAGVFQLNTVTRHNGMNRVINDWEVGVPGFFGRNVRATLTAFLVQGTAPGKVSGHEVPISNVVHETFTIGG
jgi:hypothetical protein